MTGDALLHHLREPGQGPSEIAADLCIAGPHGQAARGPVHCGADGPHPLRHQGSQVLGPVGPQAAGNLDDMADYSLACKSQGISYIFDPGQSLPMWQPPDLTRCIEGSRILISNDYELELIMSNTGLDKSSLLAKTGMVITTLGEDGSRVITPAGELTIPAVKPDKVVDPTGAGDAYRAGLIKGLVQNDSVVKGALMGGVCASFAVECYGTQEYRFSPEDFAARLESYPPDLLEMRDPV